MDWVGQAVREQQTGQAEFWQVLADNIPQLAWVADPSGWIYWYNRRWYEFTGTTLADMEGWGWKALHHPDEVERVVESFSAAIKSGEPWEDVFPLRGGNGEYRQFLSRANPIRDPSGRITHWFGTNTDVTEQLETERKLRRSEERYRSLFKSIDEGFCLVELIDDETGKAVDYRFVETNPAFAAQSGLHEVAGKTIRQIAPEYENLWVKNYAKVAETGEPLRFVGFAGALNRWFDVYAFRFGDASERQVAVCCSAMCPRKRTARRRCGRARRAQGWPPGRSRRSTRPLRSD